MARRREITTEHDARYPDPREQNLPQWAQERLAATRRYWELTEEKLAAQLGSVEKTNIWYGDYDSPIHLPLLRGLGTGSVHFQTHGPRDDDRNDFMHDIQIRHMNGRDEHWLDICAGDSLLVKPYSSNGLRIRTER